MTEKEWADEGMLLITAVRQDRKERQRYQLFVDGGEEPFISVHEDLLIKFRLMKDRQIHPDELRQIGDEDSNHRAYVMSLAYLGAKPRTQKEIMRYLSRKGMDERAAEKAIERLTRERLVDDISYANRFAAERMHGQLKGRRLLRQELEQRGIAKATAKEASEHLDPESEAEAAIRAATKKWPYLKGEYRDRKRKLALFLLRRGFPDAVVKRAINEAAQEAHDDEEWDMLDN